MIPSLTDLTMAPPGKHMMSVWVQCPAKINGREWTDEERWIQIRYRPDL